MSFLMRCPHCDNNRLSVGAIHCKECGLVSWRRDDRGNWITISQCLEEDEKDRIYQAKWAREAVEKERMYQIEKQKKAKEKAKEEQRQRIREQREFVATVRSCIIVLIIIVGFITVLCTRPSIITGILSDIRETIQNIRSSRPTQVQTETSKETENIDRHPKSKNKRDATSQDVIDVTDIVNPELSNR